MRVLDLFCNAGGAAAGYSRAGFEVVGVDINYQPNYPFHFIEADALSLMTVRSWEGFALVHASPPCQYGAAITKGTNKHLRQGYPDLYPQTKALLEESGLPYVIENPDSRPDVVLCGEMFGLGVLRHRRFELGNWSTAKPQHLKHRGYVRGMRHGIVREGPYIAAYGKGGGKGNAREMQQAMGIDWTDVHEELVEMLPPAYTQWIGEQFLAHTKKESHDRAHPATGG
jgi:DNA (cytosine-5)-methyltransferase 1